MTQAPRRGIGWLLRSARKANWPAFVHNRWRQLTHPERKIFIIGYNRCATNSLNDFFRYQGLKGLHWCQGDRFLALETDLRKDDDAAMRAFLAGWTVFSDFTYLPADRFLETQGLFATYARICPEAYFIYNDRDVDKWIASRLRFIEGDFLARYTAATGHDRDQAVAAWRRAFTDHRAAVLQFFVGHPRFVHFNIEPHDGFGADPIHKVIDLVRADYRLDARYWDDRQGTSPPLPPQDAGQGERA